MRMVLQAALLAGLGLPSASATAGPTLDKAVAAAEAMGFSGVIAAGDRHEVTYQRALGLADRALARPHRVGQVWPWASVTKQVTAALVMREVDRGRLSLEASVKSLLPEFTGPTGDRITLRHLLQHTSGLPNPIETPLTSDEVPGFYRERGAGTSDAARARGFCSGQPKAEPGTGFSYNNCDTQVAGAILERLNGARFLALVRNEVARPLGLRSLGFAKEDQPAGGTGLIGYEAGKPAVPINFAALGAAGALVGSASDLVRFNQALMGHRIVSQTSTAEMWKGEPKLGYVALGAWSFRANLKGCNGQVALVERRGHFGGIQVRSVIAPALGRTIVAFTNNGDLEFGEVWQGKGLTYELASAAFCAGQSD
ncbi:serine hydrolase [Erythrobacter sp.]|uniref:serine hydrolase domain-containing protein n=1 Tax=Erythrobacter sp. TaxID=1042 RepID=UPI0025CF1C33|nr:serine hydrolase domain-containing protein [Erythrobacter sp.]